ncbi:MAG: MFS transporter [Candidatus Hermodarchaeota archaeon]
MSDVPLTAAKKRNIRVAGLVSIFICLQLVTFDTYVVIFLQKDLLASIAIITIIVSFRNISQLFLRIPLGDLSQIIGRRPLILVGHFCFTIALGLLFFSDIFLVFIATLFVAFGMSAYWSSMFAYLSDISPERFGESNGRIFQMCDLGIIIASFLAKILIDELLFELKNVFGLIAGLGVLFGLLSIIILPETLLKGERKQVSSIGRAVFNSFAQILPSLWKITSSEGMKLIYAINLVIAFIEFTLVTYLPLLIVNKGYTRGNVAEIILWATIAIIWFKPFLGKMADKFDASYTITLTLVIFSLSIFAFLIIQDFLFLIIIYIIFNGSLITAITTVNGEVSRKAPLALQGMAMGAVGFYVSLGRATSTIVLGPIWEITGLENVFFFTAIGVFLVAIVMFFFLRISRTIEKNEKL